MTKKVDIELKKGFITLTISGKIEPGCVLNRDKDDNIIINMNVNKQHLQGKISRRSR